MTKQSIFSRIGTLARANINAMLDRAEDPEKMLDQMIRDYTNSISEAETAVAQTIGNLRMLEDDYKEDIETARSWEQKARAASQRADQFREEGEHSSADKFDNLAKVALEHQMHSEKDARNSEPTISSQNEVVEKLKNGLEQMKKKRTELVSKRDELTARQKSAQAQATVHDAVKSIDMMDPASEVSRFEEKVRREESRVRGMNELAASSLDAQFESLEDLGEQTEVEARLAALKSGGNNAVTSSRAQQIENASDEELFASLETEQSTQK